LQCEFGELLECDFFAGVEQAKHLFDGCLHLLNQIETPPVQQPPAQAQISPVRLKVVAIRLLEVVVIVVLEVDARAFRRRLRRRQRDNRREVIPATEQIQLYPREQRKQSQRINQRKRPCYRCPS
jgi:hypothetical protein